jgi:hypothetical protein
LFTARKALESPDSKGDSLIETIPARITKAAISAIAAAWYLFKTS